MAIAQSRAVEGDGIYVFLQNAVKKRADERTRTADLISSYEFACVRTSPSWCVR